MQDISKVHLKDSIATHLLKIIFGLYLLVTVILTSIQLSVEYSNAKNSIASEIQSLHKTFEQSLTTSLWTYNQNLLKSVLQGMSEVTIITGVKILDEVDNEVQMIGAVIDKDGQYIFVSKNGESTAVSKDIFFQNLSVLSFLFHTLTLQANYTVLVRQ